MAGQQRNLDISKIFVPEIRVTAVYDDDLTKMLGDSLESAGQLQPILVVQTEEGYELVDGLHRLQAAQERREKKIPAVVVQGDSTTALLYNLITNNMRGKTKASEMVQVIDHLVHEKELDSIQIAERTGMTRDYIEKLWKISESHPMVREALDKELIGVGVAYEISRLPRPEQQESVMLTVSTYHMPVKKVKEIVDDTLQIMKESENAPAPVVQLAPEPPPLPSCEICKGEHDMLVAVQLGPRCFGQIAYLVAQAQASEADDSPPASTSTP